MSILGNVDWQKQGSEAFTYLKGLGNKVKQMALQLTEVEIKVEDATNNEPWGPHGKDMAGEKESITTLAAYLYVQLHPIQSFHFSLRSTYQVLFEPKQDVHSTKTHLREVFCLHIA